jgi:hypothetical protein
MSFAAGRNAAIQLKSLGSVANNVGTSGLLTVNVENWSFDNEVVEDEVTNSGSGICVETLPIREDAKITCELPWDHNLASISPAQPFETIFGSTPGTLGTAILTDVNSANVVFHGYVGEIVVPTTGLISPIPQYQCVARITKISFVTNARKAARFRIEMRKLSMLFMPGQTPSPALTPVSYPVAPS